MYTHVDALLSDLVQKHYELTSDLGRMRHTPARQLEAQLVLFEGQVKELGTIILNLCRELPLEVDYPS